LHDILITEIFVAEPQVGPVSNNNLYATNVNQDLNCKLPNLGISNPLFAPISKPIINCTITGLIGQNIFAILSLALDGGSPGVDRF